MANRGFKNRVDRLFGSVFGDKGGSHSPGDVHATMRLILSDAELYDASVKMARYVREKFNDVAGADVEDADERERRLSALNDDPQYLALHFTAERRMSEIRASPSLANGRQKAAPAPTPNRPWWERTNDQNTGTGAGGEAT